MLQQVLLKIDFSVFVFFKNLIFFFLFYARFIWNFWFYSFLWFLWVVGFYFFIFGRCKKINPLFTIFQNFILLLLTSSNITIKWNFGSLLGVCLIVQILSGFFLAIHYASDLSVAFCRVSHIMRDVQLGWIFLYIHANGARFFFICIYLHIARGIYYGSY